MFRAARKEDLDAGNRVDVFQRVLYSRSWNSSENETTSFSFRVGPVKVGDLLRVKRSLGPRLRVAWDKWRILGELFRPERARNLEKLARL